MSATNRQARWIRLLLLVLCSCLTLLHCVIGGNTACKTTGDCPGSQICFSGICLSPKSEQVIKSEPASELPADRGGEPPGVDVPSETGPPDARPPEPRTDKGVPEDVPEPINYGPQRRIGLTSGGGAMSSSGYRLYGSVSAGIWSQSQPSPQSWMSSPSYRLRAGIIAGTTP